MTQPIDPNTLKWLTQGTSNPGGQYGVSTTGPLASVLNAVLTQPNGQPPPPNGIPGKGPLNPIPASGSQFNVNTPIAPGSPLYRDSSGQLWHQNPDGTVTLMPSTITKTEGTSTIDDISNGLKSLFGKGGAGAPPPPAQDFNNPALYGFQNFSPEAKGQSNYFNQLGAWQMSQAAPQMGRTAIDWSGTGKTPQPAGPQPMGAGPPPLPPGMGGAGPMPPPGVGPQRPPPVNAGGGVGGFGPILNNGPTPNPGPGGGSTFGGGDLLGGSAPPPITPSLGRSLMGAVGGQMRQGFQTPPPVTGGTFSGAGGLLGATPSPSGPVMPPPPGGGFGGR